VDVALRVDQLTVARGRVGLLSDFSLLLRSGETVHLVGANGSGKSSLLRVLAGVVEPRRGSVTRAMPCAYVPEPLELPGALPAQRWLRICRSQVGLPAELARRCGKLSKGQLQRLVILTALADAQGRRALFILDEPWSGLDRDSCARLDNELAAAAARGCAVLYTDHSGATTLANTRTISLTHGGVRRGFPSLHGRRGAGSRRRAGRRVGPQPGTGGPPRRGLEDRRSQVGALRYAAAQLSLALSSRRLLPPAALLLFAVIGVYGQPKNPVLESFAVTAIVTALICSLFVLAVERESAGTASELLTAATGGAAVAWRGRLVLVGVVVCPVTIFCLAWPTATGAFAHVPEGGDLLAAVLVHVACGLFGGALALVLSAPTRAAVAFVAILVVILGSVPLATALGVFAGPGGIEQALNHTAPNALTPSLLVAVGITLVEAALLAYAARWLARWRG